MSEARNWYHSHKYQEAKKHRVLAVNILSFLQQESINFKSFIDSRYIIN